MKRETASAVGWLYVRCELVAEAGEGVERGRQGGVPLLYRSCTAPVPLQYDVFLAGHGAARSHASLPDYQRRRELFHASRRLIEAHNARRDRQYTLEMNRCVCVCVRVCVCGVCDVCCQ